MARPLLYYLPLLPSICMICAIIGVGVWVHYTISALHQVEYAVEILGTSVTATNLDRVIKAVEGTSSSYLIFACALFGLGLYRRLLSVQADTTGPDAKQLTVYRAANAGVHFLWWLIMAWVVVLWGGLAIFGVLIWTGHQAVSQILSNQAVMAPAYANWVGGIAGWTLSPEQLAAAGGDVIVAVTRSNGWPTAPTCPATCADLQLFQFLEVDASQSCVCDKAVLTAVLEATQAALDALPGIFVGIWFMYVFGDLLKTSLACDFVGASRDSDGEHGGALGGAGLRKAASAGRGYSKL